MCGLFHQQFQRTSFSIQHRSHRFSKFPPKYEQPIHVLEKMVWAVNHQKMVCERQLDRSLTGFSRIKEKEQTTF